MKNRTTRGDAYLAVINAIRHGELVRPKHCSRCGKASARIHGHHEDYSRPLDVMWLCVACHQQRHAETNTAMNGRQRCAGCGRVVYRHRFESGTATYMDDGAAVHTDCFERAMARRKAIA